MYRIAVIDESPDCQTYVQNALVHARMEISKFGTISEVHRLMAEASRTASDGAGFDLILLSVGMGEGASLILLNELQNHDRFKQTPIILMSCRDDVMTKVAAFSAGADDYILKMIDPAEFRARIEMRLRKSTVRKVETLRYNRGTLSISVDAREVTVLSANGLTPVHLTNKEFSILHFLAKEEGRAYTRTQIVDHVWGEGVHVVDRNVDSHICALRKKLGRAGNYLQSVSGAGYRFVPEKVGRNVVDMVRPLGLELDFKEQREA